MSTARDELDFDAWNEDILRRHGWERAWKVRIWKWTSYVLIGACVWLAGERSRYADANKELADALMERDYPLLHSFNETAKNMGAAPAQLADFLGGGPQTKSVDESFKAEKDDVE
jgi:hypothetical protein